MNKIEKLKRLIEARESYGSDVVTAVSELVNLIGVKEARLYYLDQKMPMHVECVTILYAETFHGV